VPAIAIQRQGNDWVSFEEFVVDRIGLWKYMPGYKVGQGYVWDLTVGALIIAGLVWASVGGRRTLPALARSERNTRT